MSYKVNKDALGITASLVCAIHCAVLPLVFTSFPVLGVNLIHNQAFEFGMIGVAFLIGTMALSHGFRMHHRSLVPWMLFTAGILLLTAKQVWHEHEGLIMPFAVGLVVGAHVVNWRLGRKFQMGDAQAGGRKGLKGCPGN